MAVLRIVREVTVLAGPTGVGKSSLMLTLAAHGSVGRTFGPFEPRYAFDSLVVNAEDSTIIMQGRLWATCKVHKMDYQSIINGDSIHLVDDKEELVLVEVVKGEVIIPERTIAFFDMMMKRFPKIRVWFLDPLGQMMGSGINENDNGQMGVVMRRIMWLARRFNVAIVLGTHVAKRLMESRDFDPASVDNIRGASAIAGRAKLITVMWGQTPVERIEQGTHSGIVSVRFVKVSYSAFSSAAHWFQRQSEFVNVSNNGLQRDSYVTLQSISGKSLISGIEKHRVQIIGNHLLGFNMTTVGVETAST